MSSFNTNLGCDSLISTEIDLVEIDTMVLRLGNDLEAMNQQGSYQWLDCGNGLQPIQGATQKRFTPTANGDYALAISQNGCVDTTACIAVRGLVNIEPSSLNGLSLFPNPTSGKIQVILPEEMASISMKLFDLRGKQLLSKSFSTAKTFEFVIPGPAGIYIVEIEVADGSLKRMKVFKE